MGEQEQGLCNANNCKENYSICKVCPGEDEHDLNLKDEKDAVADVPCNDEKQRGVIKQLLKKEIKRLSDEVSTLRNSEQYEKARDIRLQQLALESFWTTLTVNGIAL